MGLRELKGPMELREKRVKWVQRAREDFQVNQETKELRGTMACQAPGDHQGHKESRGKMVPGGTPAMLDQEEILEQLDQRATLADLALAILDQEDHRVREEKRAIVDLVAAEETVVKRASPEIKELRESQVSQDLRVNPA